MVPSKLQISVLPVSHSDDPGSKDTRVMVLTPELNWECLEDSVRGIPLEILRFLQIRK